MKNIGITTTVPVEVLLAANYKVIDLNNIFITADDYARYIDLAERDGFPKSSCAWIKGIYGTCIEKGIQEVVGVLEGDCSNTRALTEVLKMIGIKVIPFSYPVSHKLEDITASINEFMGIFDVNLSDVEKIRKRLSTIRGVARQIDLLTHQETKVKGFENHLCQVSLSDFNSDANEFEKTLKEKLAEIETRPDANIKVRLGYIGVPPMTGDLYDYIEEFDARILYNEVQREFAFPRADQAANIYEQYHDYTYPYDIGFRLQEIKKQVQERKLDGIIHYTQAFCYRAIEDIIIKKSLDIPVLNIEGDKLNCLDSRTKLRIEAFVDMLRDKKEVQS